MALPQTGVVIHVSRWKAPLSEEELKDSGLSSPMGPSEDPTAERVHEWMLHERRLRPGRHRLDELLRDIIWREPPVEGEAARSLCVSLCGSQAAMMRTRKTLHDLQQQMRGAVELSLELAADYHG